MEQESREAGMADPISGLDCCTFVAYMVRRTQMSHKSSKIQKTKHQAKISGPFFDDVENPPDTVSGCVTDERRSS